MFYTCKLIVLGLYMTTLLHRTQSFVLLTANVEDLKRIIQKFVSHSLGDKIARFIIEAADSNVDFDNSNVIRDLSEYNDEFDVKKKDINPDYVEEFRQKSDTNVKKEHKHVKPSSFTAKTKAKTEEVLKYNKKENKKKKQFKSKNKAKKLNKITSEQSSLEYYRSDKQLNKINPNTFVDLEKIHESDDSSITSRKLSRKEFKNLDYFEKNDKAEVKTDKLDSKIHKYIENDVSVAAKVKKDSSENVSDDFNYSNRLDIKSEEPSTTKTNLTTKKERNEFDQYYNSNYPKADVVAISGPVELSKSPKNDSYDTDYE